MEFEPIKPSFFCCFALDIVADSFVLMGIYSKEEDAEQHKAECLANPIFRGAATVSRMTMDQIKTQLIQDRLGVLADAVGKLYDVAASHGMLGEA